MNWNGWEGNGRGLIGILPPHLTGGASVRVAGVTTNILPQSLRTRGTPVFSLSQLYEMKIARRSKYLASGQFAFCVNTHFTCGSSTKTSDYRLPQCATSQQVAGAWGSMSRPPNNHDSYGSSLCYLHGHTGARMEYKNRYCYIIINRDSVVVIATGYGWTA
jgi:hypothetical protein